MNVRVSWQVEDFSTSWKYVSYSWATLMHGVRRRCWHLWHLLPPPHPPCMKSIVATMEMFMSELSFTCGRVLSAAVDLLARRRHGPFVAPLEVRQPSIPVTTICEVGHLGCAPARETHRECWTGRTQRCKNTVFTPARRGVGKKLNTQHQALCVPNLNMDPKRIDDASSESC
jgi:hypothetical protein